MKNFSNLASGRSIYDSRPARLCGGTIRSGWLLA